MAKLTNVRNWLVEQANAMMKLDAETNGGQCINAPYKIRHPKSGEFYTANIKVHHSRESANAPPVVTLEIVRPAKVVAGDNVAEFPQKVYEDNDIGSVYEELYI